MPTGQVSVKLLDYRDPDLVGDIKYLWEPNRHLHLVTLAQGYALSGKRAYFDTIALEHPAQGAADEWIIIYDVYPHGAPLQNILRRFGYRKVIPEVRGAIRVAPRARSH